MKSDLCAGLQSVITLSVASAHTMRKFSDQNIISSYMHLKRINVSCEQDLITYLLSSQWACKSNMVIIKETRSDHVRRSKHKNLLQKMIRQ